MASTMGYATPLAPNTITLRFGSYAKVKLTSPEDLDLRMVVAVIEDEQSPERRVSKNRSYVFSSITIYFGLLPCARENK